MYRFYLRASGALKEVKIETAAYYTPTVLHK